MSASHLALMRVYAALDPLYRPDVPEEKRLAAELQALGLEVEEQDDPRVAFEEFAAEVTSERSGEGVEGPIPLVRVLETTMDVLGARVEVSDETLRSLSEQFVTESARSDDGVIAGVVEALRIASDRESNTDAERWPTFRQAALERGSPLLAEVLVVRRSFCDGNVFWYRGEWATRIETYFEVDGGPYDLERLAKACMPDNWATCNRFFCSLTHCPDRDRDCPDSTPGTPPQPRAPHWRTVFEEKVLDCPDGVFPDTFLLFTWTRLPRQLILEYELAPRRHGDRTVLTLDQGYVLVDELTSAYSVQTVKKLLFNDARLPSGGQTLAHWACKLGWLDCSITQFTDCAEALPLREGSGDVAEPDSAKTRLLGIVDGWEEQLRERADETVSDVDECVAHFRRAGDVGFDDHFAVWAQKLATRAGRDGSNWAIGQLDYAVASADLVREFEDKWRQIRGWA